MLQPMADILQFRKRPPGEKARHKTLCREGFHKWAIWQKKQFDVKAGKLVTVYRCARCEATRVETH